MHRKKDRRPDQQLYVPKSRRQAKSSESETSSHPKSSSSPQQTNQEASQKSSKRQIPNKKKDFQSVAINDSNPCEVSPELQLNGAAVDRGSFVVTGNVDDSLTHFSSKDSCEEKTASAELEKNLDTATELKNLDTATELKKNVDTVTELKKNLDTVTEVKKNLDTPTSVQDIFDDCVQGDSSGSLNWPSEQQDIEIPLESVDKVNEGLIETQSDSSKNPAPGCEASVDKSEISSELSSPRVVGSEETGECGIEFD